LLQQRAAGLLLGAPQAGDIIDSGGRREPSSNVIAAAWLSLQQMRAASRWQLP